MLDSQDDIPKRLSVKQAQNKRFFNIGVIVNIVAILAYGALILYYVMGEESFYEFATTCDPLGMGLRSVVWFCQVFSFSFLLLSTFKIRQLIVRNTNMSRVMDNKMVTFMVVCVSIILLAYIGVYTILLFTAIDPNLSIMIKENKEEEIVSVFLLI